jgi:hypothetical protein
MAHAWESHQVKNPETAAIVDEGLEKLEEYRAWTDFVPAYVLAMSSWLHSYLSLFLSVHIPFPVINPAVKLDWYEEHMPEKVQQAKDLFIQEANQFIFVLETY